LKAIILGVALVWCATAILPVNRAVWALENIWVFIGIIGMALAFRRFPFSDMGYLLIALYMCLHLVAAHYTYEQVTIGFWLQNAFGLARNDYDRLVHFAFGLLLTYPTRELFLYVRPGMPNWLTHYLSLNSMMALSAVHEIMEAYVGAAADPRTQPGYLSLQGDLYDSQHDMAATLVAALLSMVITVAVEYIQKRRRIIPREEPVKADTGGS